MQPLQPNPGIKRVQLLFRRKNLQVRERPGVRTSYEPAINSSVESLRRRADIHRNIEDTNRVDVSTHGEIFDATAIRLDIGEILRMLANEVSTGTREKSLQLLSQEKSARKFRVADNNSKLARETHKCGLVGKFDNASRF